MSSFLRAPRVCRAAAQSRGLATPTTTPTRREGFSKMLAAGPSLDEFASGDAVEKVVFGNSLA